MNDKEREYTQNYESILDKFQATTYLYSWTIVIYNPTDIRLFMHCLMYIDKLSIQKVYKPLVELS